MTITSNGSKWCGESPDSVETLISVLGMETLDPGFEGYGRFFWMESPGVFRAFGNFLTCSHVFDIEGTLAEMLPLALAIKAARRKAEYIKARRSSSPS